MMKILRRSFIWKMGAGASAALAPTMIMTAGIAKAEAGTTDNPALRAALLEEGVVRERVLLVSELAKCSRLRLINSVRKHWDVELVTT